MIMIMIMIRYWKDSIAGYIQEGGGPFNYNKSSPKIQLLNCSSEIVSKAISEIQAAKVWVFFLVFFSSSTSFAHFAKAAINRLKK